MGLSNLKGNLTIKLWTFGLGVFQEKIRKKLYSKKSLTPS